MKRMTLLASLALGATALAGAAAVAQPYGARYDSGNFWQGAPDGLQQRIDWLQQRIDRGRSDGSLDPMEARRNQNELDNLRRDADQLQRRLDDLSRNIRWSRRGGNGYYGGSYGGGSYGGDYRAPYSTDYDAYRYYRDDPRYTERRLSNNDEIYRGSDGRYYCKRSDGTTGLVIGAVGGAAIGSAIDSQPHGVTGLLIGGALGALAGKAVDQNSDVRCR
jgi:opacity protein-like surface antigen